MVVVVLQLLHWQHCDYKRGGSTEGDSGNDPGAGAEADPIHAKFSQPRYPSLPVAKKRLCFYKCKYKHKYTTEITEAVSPSRFPCCVLSYFSLVFVVDKSKSQESVELGIQLGMGKGGAQYHQDRLTY